MAGVGSPEATHGNTALWPMTLTKEEGCFKNTKLDVAPGSEKKKLKQKKMVKSLCGFIQRNSLSKNDRKIAFKLASIS